MKPRTVMLTLELRDCTVPLSELRAIRLAHVYRGCGRGGFEEGDWIACLDVAQATATVAQPSGRVVNRDHPASRRARKKGKRR